MLIKCIIIIRGDHAFKKLIFLLKYRSGECGGTAYVTFSNSYALETAVLLSVRCFSYSF